MSRFIEKTEQIDAYTTRLHVRALNKKIYKMDVYIGDFKKYQAGELIQNAFPYLGMNEREILISGIDGQMWEKIYGKEDDV